MPHARSNPFTTSRVCGEIIEWVTTSAEPEIAELLTRFRTELKSRASIIGPHGSGKSTLLDHIQRNFCTEVLQLHVGTEAHRRDEFVQTLSQLPPNSRIGIRMTLRGRKSSGQIVHSSLRASRELYRSWFIDGYEQLSIYRRCELLWKTKRSRDALLVTSHSATALPTLCVRRIDINSAMMLIDRVLQQGAMTRPEWLTDTLISGLLRKHSGNMREVFMELYDRVEDTA